MLSAIDLFSTYAGKRPDLDPWMSDAIINRDRNLRLQYLAGLGLNLYQSDVIYADMLKYARYPEELFAAIAGDDAGAAAGDSRGAGTLTEKVRFKGSRARGCMRTRAIVLTAVVSTAATMIAAGPTLLVPAEGSPLSVARGPGNVLFGDVNKDGKPDLLVASSQSRRLTILLGRGDGRFAPVAGAPLTVPENPTEMALGDLNADGNLDVALASHDSYAVTLLLGDGRGAFSPAPGSPVIMKDGKQPHTHGLGISDVNGDSRADLVTVNSNDDNDVSVRLADGKGGFVPAPGSPFAVGPAPYPLALGDINADGKVDMVVTSTGLGSAPGGGSPSKGLTALVGDGRGGFRRSEIPTRTNRTWFVAIGDVNADRQPDLVATHTEDRLMTVLLGDGRGNFTEVKGSPFDLGRNAWAVQVVDLNRDGKTDAVAAAENGVRVLLGDGRGGFTQAPGSPFATGKGTWKLAVADVNGDGRPDVAATNLESDTVSVLVGRDEK